MDLLPSEEQTQIVDASVSFLEKELPVSLLVNDDSDKPLIDRDKLAQVAELGWFGIGLPEEHGGVGYGLQEETLLFVAMGRYLISSNILGIVLAARLAAFGGQHELLNALLDGSKRVALTRTQYQPKANISNEVSGTFLAFDAEDADLLLFIDEHGAALVDKQGALQAGTANIEAARCVDEKTHLQVGQFNNAATLVYLPAEQENIYLRGTLLCAAMQLGIAEATLDRSVEYAKVREQYGKPIGSFQAIKHYCANMAVRCESVRSMLCYASVTQQQQSSSSQYDTLVAKALASDAAQENANTAIQIHGGMGFTAELDIHLFVKRAQVLEQLFGSKRRHLNALLAQGEPAL